MINVGDGGERYDVLSAGGGEYNKTFVANAYEKKNIISFLCSMYTVGGNNNVYMCTYTPRRSTMMIVRVLYTYRYVYVYFLSDFFFVTSPTLIPLIDDRSCTTIQIYIFKHFNVYIIYIIVDYSN